MSQVAQYALLAGYVLVGLWAYERWGIRLGGVLALPLVAVYALIVPWALEIFAVGAVVSFTVGEVLHRRTLVYGRRLFAVHIVASVVASFLFTQAFDVPLNGFLLPVLPGVFAFNLHREGRPVQGAVVFVGALIGLMVAGLALETLLQIDPASAQSAVPPAGGGTLHNPGNDGILMPCIEWLQEHLGTSDIDAGTIAIGGSVWLELGCEAAE